MIVKKIKNKKLLLQVLDTTRVIDTLPFVSNNGKYFLVFDLLLSKASKIKSVKKIGVVFEDEENRKEVIYADFEKTFYFNKSNTHILSLEVQNDLSITPFLNSNKFNIHLIDGFNNVLDSSGSKSFVNNLKISDLISQAITTENELESFITDNINSKNIIMHVRLYESDTNKRLLIINDSNTDISAVNITYNNIRLDPVISDDDSNNFYFDFDLGRSQHRLVLKDIYLKYLEWSKLPNSDASSLEAKFSFSFYIDNGKNKFLKEYTIGYAEIVRIYTVYNRYLVNEFNNNISIKESEYNSTYSKLVFEFNDDLIEVKDSIIVKSFIHVGSQLREDQRIYANQDLNEDNYILYIDKPLTTILNNNSITYYYDSLDKRATAIKLSVNDVESIIDIEMSSEDDYTGNNSYIENYSKELSKIKVFSEVENLVLDKGINSAFKFKNVKLIDENTDLPEILNYISTNSENGQPIINDFNDMIDKGLYKVSLTITFNNITIGANSSAYTYNQLSSDGFINNILDKIRINNAIVPDEVFSLFSNIKKENKISILHDIPDFNITLNMNVMPLFDPKSINQYRFSGFDQDVYNNESLYVIEEIYGDSTSESNQDLYRFISSITNNNINFDLTNNLIGNYLSKDLNKFQKSILIESLMKDIYKDNKIKRKFNRIDSISKNKLIRFYDREKSRALTVFELNNHNISLERSNESSFLFYSTNRFVNKTNDSIRYKTNKNSLIFETNSLDKVFYLNIEYFFDIEEESYENFNDKYNLVDKKLYFDRDYMSNSNNFIHYNKLFKNRNVIDLNKNKLIVFDINDLFLFNSKELEVLLSESIFINRRRKNTISSINFTVNIYNKHYTLMQSLDVRVVSKKEISTANKKINLMNNLKDVK